MAKSGLKGGKLIFMNLIYVVIGLIVLRVADPFKWWVPGPEKVAKEFLLAIENGDYRDAKKLADEPTQLEIDHFRDMVSYPEYNYIYVMDVIKEDDHATVMYELGYDGKTFALDLNRIDKEWKASISSPLLLTRYEDETTYDDGTYEWENVEAEVIDGSGDELQFSKGGKELSDEEAKKLIEELMRELDLQTPTK